MTISSTNRKAGPYAGNDVAVAFPFSFKVFSASDLYVVRADSIGAETVLTLEANYTVTLNSNQDSNPGGTITLPAPLASGYTLTIASQLENLQPTELTNQGGFYPKVITNALDRLTILVQQLAESVSRSLKTAISTPDGFNSTLPTPVPYALIGWNAAGNGFQNTDPTYSTALSSDLANSTNMLKGAALVGGTGRVVSDIAALRLLPKTGSSYAFVLGYYAKGDGGGGAYFYDSVDTTSADNGGTIIVASDGGRWKLANTGTISVKQFGVKGGSDAGDPARIQSTINAVAAGTRLFFPKDNYIATGLSVTKPLHLLGEGYQNGATKLITGSSTADVLTISGTSGVLVSGFYFTSSVTRTAGKYIAVAGSDRVRIENFYMDGYYIGIDVDSLSTIVTIDSFAMFNGVYGAIQLGKTGRVEHVSIDNGYIKNETTPAVFGVSAGYVDVLALGSGLTIINHGNDFFINPSSGQVASLINSDGTVFDTAENGVLIQPTGNGKVIRADFDGIWCGENTVNGFSIDGTGASTLISGVKVNGGDFIHNSGNGINIDGANAKQITVADAQIAANGIGLRLSGGCSDLTIESNFIGAYGDAAGNTTGMAVASNVTGALNDNTFGTNTTNESGIAAATGLYASGNKGIDNWKPYTPTITAETGTFTTVSAVGRYRVSGNQCDVEVEITITTNGTAATGVICSLPFASKTALLGLGRANGSGGFMLQVFTSTGLNTARIYKTDNTYPGSSGQVLIINASFEF